MTERWNGLSRIIQNRNRDGSVPAKTTEESVKKDGRWLKRVQFGNQKVKSNVHKEEFQWSYVADAEMQDGLEVNGRC